MNKKNDFAVIDIGTNAMKCIAFVDGKQEDTFRNKTLTQSGNDNLNPDEILNHIESFIEELHAKGIPPKKIYIAATEGFRRSTNQEAIQKLIKEKTGKLIHPLSPKREAYLSALGGLSYVKEKFKGNPSKVMYIEAGGGSTEISIIDTSKRSFFAITDTVSIPLGSKNKIDENIIAETLKPLLAQMRKNIKREDDVAVVINSSSVSRIVARRYNKEKYNPQQIAEQQYTMRVHNFLKKLDEIRNMSEEEQKAQFYLNDERLDGFLNHADILREILKQTQRFTKQAQLSTTIGGLKHGLAKEIAVVKDENVEQVFKDKPSLTVSTENKELEQKLKKINENKAKTLGLEEKAAEEYLWQTKVKLAVAAANETSNGKFKFKEVKNKDNSSKQSLEFQDEVNENNRIRFNSPNNASVSGDINSYYVLCETAKNQGKSIKFGNMNSIEEKALLYQACLEKGIAVKNAPELEDLRESENFGTIKKLLEKTSRNKNIKSLQLKNIQEERSRA